MPVIKYLTPVPNGQFPHKCEQDIIDMITISKAKIYTPYIIHVPNNDLIKFLSFHIQKDVTFFFSIFN